MSVPLVVILGAGASRGSGDYGEELRPPLTVDLFDTELFGSLLAEYDMAHQAGRFIAREQTRDSALALEHVLHQLSTSNFAHHRQMAKAVPPYLQHLLHEVSARHYKEAPRYDHLIERLLCLPYVYFATLNYDVMLDRRLATHHPLGSFDDYITRDKNWSLIKLHGSINWFHETSEPFNPASPPPSLHWDYSEFACVPPDATLQAIRDTTLTRTATSNYPALALPEGPDDRLVLPEAHEQFFREGIAEAHQIDLLVLGYSGIDKQVLELLGERRHNVRRLTVVNTDFMAASEVHGRLEEAGVSAVWPEVISGNFADWADGGGLNRLVEEYDGPYA
jgi:hypothetical protein